MNTQEAYQQKFEAKLKEADAEISRLSAKAEGATADRKLELEKQVNELRSKRDSIGSKLSELKDKSGDAAGDVQSGLESAWDEFTNSLSSARDRLN
ncbi:MAG: coiled coil domain-containing protein [Pseudomonadota bacterium]